jgi:Transposase IS66 family
MARCREDAAARAGIAAGRRPALRIWLRRQYTRLSFAGLVAKTIAYGGNCRDGPVRFFDDGRLRTNNNAAERALRGIAVGRHDRDLRAGSDAGHGCAAAIDTRIETPTPLTRERGSPPSSSVCRITPSVRIVELLPGKLEAVAAKRRHRMDCSQATRVVEPDSHGPQPDAHQHHDWDWPLTRRNVVRSLTMINKN